MFSRSQSSKSLSSSDKKSKSPFSSLDNKLNRQSSSGSTSSKQSTLSSFIQQAKPKASSNAFTSIKRSSSSLSSTFDNSTRKSHAVDLTDDSDDVLENKKRKSILLDIDSNSQGFDDNSDGFMGSMSSTSSTRSTISTSSRHPSFSSISRSSSNIEVKSNYFSQNESGRNPTQTNSFSSSSTAVKSKSQPSIQSNKPSFNFSSLRSSVPSSKTPALPQSSKKRELPWVIKRQKMANPRQSNNKNPNSQSHSTSYSSMNGFVLSDEQSRVIDIVLNGKKNVFYTGAAGTGKSIVLGELVRRLRSRYGESSVAVTASTGLAATTIRGVTINKFAGIGLGIDNINGLVHRIQKNRETLSRWQQTKVLIIDEISMIDARLFSKLNAIAKIIRKSDKPFGNIQLVLTGDFFQLPPVTRNDPNFKNVYCFHSTDWKEVIQETILLSKVYRQKGDNTLIDMLNALRIGEVTESLVQSFKSLERPVNYEDGILPTELYPTRDEVQRANSRRIESLSGRSVIYNALDTGGEMFAKSLDSNVMALKRLELKVGAQVIMLKYLNQEVVNGTVGKIMAFLTPGIWADITASFTPGELLNNDSLISLIGDFIGRQDYTEDLDVKYANFCRETNLISLKLMTIDRLLRKARLVKLDPEIVLPIVKFTVNSPERFQYHLVEREVFTLDGNSKDVYRNQIPLLLSWALSIHKSQGQTISRLKVDLSKIFEIGQVYVALSRATSADTLEIVNFRPTSIRVSTEVKNFYENLKILK
ncbi:hypothetical protein BVG19_g5433 [[Candida] boidinii]|nr:hypothetical protein BVG19_g5433 [[Candida] boidinii]OWB51694.1 hypothetical protein B5S27_g3260 [[Candida] boidinii]